MLHHRTPAKLENRGEKKEAISKSGHLIITHGAAANEHPPPMAAS